MSVQKLLALGEPIFKKIDEAIKAKKFDEAYALLNSPQPTEWVKEEKNIHTKEVYYYNDMELIEALLTKIFKRWKRRIQSNVVTQEKSKYISTTIVILEYLNLENKWDVVDGIASVPAPNLEWLQLAVPLSATNAKGNAARQLGSLFGLSLNRIEGQEKMPPLQTITQDYGNVDDEEKKKYLDFKALLESAETKQVAEIMLSGSEFKLIRELQLIVQNKK